jgi:nucleoid-associated protein YgaU
MGLQLARVEILGPRGDDPTGAVVDSFEVRFNPTDYTLNKAVQIAEIAIPGLDSPLLQFVRGQNEKLTLELFFDTTEHGMGESGARSVRELTDRFYRLVKIDSETHAPPRIRFTWGSHLAFKAVVESVQQKFTLFSPAGVPLRATLSLVLREYKTLEEQLRELNLQSADQTKWYVVKANDTLTRIASEMYQDPREWRAIADENPKVQANPRQLRPGEVLKIPPLDVFSQQVTPPR